MAASHTDATGWSAGADQRERALPDGRRQLVMTGVELLEKLVCP
jgi:hypothetical protein